MILLIRSFPQDSDVDFVMKSENATEAALLRAVRYRETELLTSALEHGVVTTTFRLKESK